MIRHKLIKLAIVVLVLTGMSADAKVVSCQYQKADGTICRWLCVSMSIDTTIHDPFCGQCDTYVEGGRVRRAEILQQLLLRNRLLDEFCHRLTRKTIPSVASSSSSVVAALSQR